MRQSRLTQAQIIGMIKEQEAVSHLHRGKTGRQAAKGPQTCAGIAHVDANGFASWRALVAGLCVRHLWRITQVPYVGRE